MSHKRTLSARFAEVHESVSAIHEYDSAGRCKQVSSQRRLIGVSAELIEEIVVSPKPTRRDPRPEGPSDVLSID